MEAVGAAASVVGIVAFGVQLCQILQIQLDDVRDADESLTQLVEEIKGTTYSITELRKLLQKDEEPSPNRIFSDEGYAELTRIIERCEIVFRNIVALVAKAGREALVAVDDFQRTLNRKDTGKAEKQVTLDIEVSKSEHLLYPFRKARIQK